MRSVAVFLTFLAAVFAVDINIDDKDSICKAAKAVADGELNYYLGTQKGGTVGMFSPPNYWWNAGEAFGGLLDYFTFCDSKNKDLEKLIFNGMYHQAGDQYNYIPSNQSFTEGNDDQGVWGMAIIAAAERNFTDPEHSWLSMAQAIYNTMNSRWDKKNCGGGLRWQIFTWNSGYNYKNSISNGCLFHISARLARYLKNDTYAKTAEKVWNWMESVFFNEEDGQLIIYDGAEIENNCTQHTKLKWSYTYGIFMSGAAYMYNYTEDHVWKTRVEEIWEVSKYFFDGGQIMQETQCWNGGKPKCNNDQRSFRSLFARSMQLTMVMVPDMYSEMRPYIEASAKGAAQSCSGGDDHVTCGQNWAASGWDGVYGLGEQQCALEVMMALLARDVSPPFTAKNGGSSKSKPNAGLDTQDFVNENALKISGKDKAGAGVLTAIVLAIILGGAVWMLF